MIKQVFSGLAYKQAIQRIETILKYHQAVGRSENTTKRLESELDKLKTLTYGSQKREMKYNELVLESKKGL
ncbi:hypothetical protein [Rossellomorea marisflavi]|uniref:hypothetical protein n=1 Tax=Rossellomorea marisflavi TaxID=189381 RepID=UPI003F9FC64F